MKKRGLSFMGIITFVGLLALIVWGIDYIATKDFVTVRESVSASLNDAATMATTTQNILPVATSTPTTTPTQTATKPAIATSTPAKTPTTTTTPPAPATSSALIVTFTDKGFSPTVLTVKKGQTVTFVNNSSGKMWVAANPFPTSTEYPAFNEKVGADVGDSWSFTFNNVGTWFYHNHYKPAQGAKIVVSPK